MRVCESAQKGEARWVLPSDGHLLLQELCPPGFLSSYPLPKASAQCEGDGS